MEISQFQVILTEKEFTEKEHQQKLMQDQINHEKYQNVELSKQILEVQQLNDKINLEKQMLLLESQQKQAENDQLKLKIQQQYEENIIKKSEYEKIIKDQQTKIEDVKLMMKKNAEQLVQTTSKFKEEKQSLEQKYQTELQQKDQQIVLLQKQLLESQQKNASINN